MGCRIYILSIRDFKDETLQQTAMNLLDSHRKALVEKYKKEQDRLRAIAAGLLLQVGFLELEVPSASNKVVDRALREVALDDVVPVRVDDDLSSAIICLEVKDAIELLQDYANKHAISLPLPLSYEYGTHGKPSWERRCIDQLWDEMGLGHRPCARKKFPHFNLSHSGDYVVLAISDTPIGVDIQMERACDYPGGYKAFSRMEAFVKCTGDGIANGRKEYEEISNVLPKYEIFGVEFFDKISYNIIAWRAL